jgi:hypothetical protein
MLDLWYDQESTPSLWSMPPRQGLIYALRGAVEAKWPSTGVTSPGKAKQTKCEVPAQTFSKVQA